MEGEGKKESFEAVFLSAKLIRVKVSSSGKKVCLTALLVFGFVCPFCFFGAKTIFVPKIFCKSGHSKAKMPEKKFFPSTTKKRQFAKKQRGRKVAKVPFIQVQDFQIHKRIV